MPWRARMFIAASKLRTRIRAAPMVDTSSILRTVYSLPPVSYTHLDVYKRQRQELDTADYVDTTGIDKIYILHDVNAISRGRKIRDLVKSRIRAERGAGCEN